MLRHEAAALGVVLDELGDVVAVRVTVRVRDRVRVRVRVKVRVEVRSGVGGEAHHAMESVCESALMSSPSGERSSATSCLSGSKLFCGRGQGREVGVKVG